MSKELLMNLYFKPVECPNCGGQAEPHTGEFFAGGEIYQVKFYCENCKTAFKKRFGGA